MEDTEKIKQIVLDAAEPLLAANGLALWGLVVTPGPTARVCLYIDVPDSASSPDAPGASASIDQCEAISRQLGLALEVEDCIDQPWVLEVSSPGLDRRFFNLEQLRSYVGDIIDIRLSRPLGDTGRKVWRGRLKEVGSDFIEIEPCSVGEDGRVLPEKSGPALIPWADVAFARRFHVFETPARPGKSARKGDSGGSGALGGPAGHLD